MSAPDLFESVRCVLVELLARKGIHHVTITHSTSILEDLGMDSLALVDLAVLLEEQLGIAEFPLQLWVDSEAVRQGKRYTVESLVEACARLQPDP